MATILPQLTVPLWPGSLYSNLPVLTVPNDTVPSPAPAAILFPFEFQLSLDQVLLHGQQVPIKCYEVVSFRGCEWV